MQADLVVRVAREPEGPTLIHLAGVIDTHTLDTFERALKAALESDSCAVVLDCEELRYVNSSGFGELIRYHDRLREQGGCLVIARVPPKVGVILEMLGLKSLIPVAAGLDEARKLALNPADLMPTPEPTPEVAPTNRMAASSGFSRVGVAAGTPIFPSESTSSRPVVCAVCDARLRIGGEGEWACAACGAPFTVTREGGIAFDWSRADADGMHLTFEVSPRSLAAFAGLIEGVLVERRVSHARMRRFAREAAHVCHLLAEHSGDGGGILHALLLAGPQRLHVRLVDRGVSLADRIDRIFSTQKRLFLDFRYGTSASGTGAGSPGGAGSAGVNVTEFAFAYAGSGVFVA